MPGITVCFITPMLYVIFVSNIHMCSFHVAILALAAICGKIFAHTAPSF